MNFAVGRRPFEVVKLKSRSYHAFFSSLDEEVYGKEDIRMKTWCNYLLISSLAICPLPFSLSLVLNCLVKYQHIISYLASGVTPHTSRNFDSLVTLHIAYIIRN
jgi:hypothetical protein